MLSVVILCGTCTRALTFQNVRKAWVEFNAAAMLEQEQKASNTSSRQLMCALMCVSLYAALYVYLFVPLYVFLYPRMTESV